MSDHPSNRARAYLAPRYWGVWVLLGFVRVCTGLPYRAQLAIGGALGNLMRGLAKRRRAITETNIARCFPELDATAQNALVRAHFRALGIALMEIGMCWWAGAGRLRRLVRMEGLEHLQAARSRGHGVILLSAHFTTLEIGGRLLGLFTDFHLMYRPSDNPLIEAVMRASRERHFERAIPRDEVRGLLNSLKENMPVWYAPDQGYRGKNSAMVPFFGIEAPTNTATSRLAAVSGAPVVPFFVERLPGTEGYLLRIEPPLDAFPSDDVLADAARVNRVIEAEIRRVPEQYLWSHDRFKVVPRD